MDYALIIVLALLLGAAVLWAVLSMGKIRVKIPLEDRLDPNAKTDVQYVIKLSQVDELKQIAQDTKSPVIGYVENSGKINTVFIHPNDLNLNGQGYSGRLGRGSSFTYNTAKGNVTNHDTLINTLKKRGYTNVKLDKYVTSPKSTHLTTQLAAKFYPSQIDKMLGPKNTTENDFTQNKDNTKKESNPTQLAKILGLTDAANTPYIRKSKEDIAKGKYVQNLNRARDQLATKDYTTKLKLSDPSRLKAILDPDKTDVSNPDQLANILGSKTTEQLYVKPKSKLDLIQERGEKLRAKAEDITHRLKNNLYEQIPVKSKIKRKKPRFDEDWSRELNVVDPNLSPRLRRRQLQNYKLSNKMPNEQPYPAWSRDFDKKLIEIQKDDNKYKVMGPKERDERLLDLKTDFLSKEEKQELENIIKKRERRNEILSESPQPKDIADELNIKRSDVDVYTFGKPRREKNLANANVTHITADTGEAYTIKHGAEGTPDSDVTWELPEKTIKTGEPIQMAERVSPRETRIVPQKPRQVRVPKQEPEAYVKSPESEKAEQALPEDSGHVTWDSERKPDEQWHKLSKEKIDGYNQSVKWALANYSDIPSDNFPPLHEGEYVDKERLDYIDEIIAFPTDMTERWEKQHDDAITASEEKLRKLKNKRSKRS